MPIFFLENCRTTRKTHGQHQPGAQQHCSELRMCLKWLCIWPSVPKDSSVRSSEPLVVCLPDVPIHCQLPSPPFPAFPLPRHGSLSNRNSKGICPWPHSYWQRRGTKRWGAFLKHLSDILILADGTSHRSAGQSKLTRYTHPRSGWPAERWSVSILCACQIPAW